MSGGYKSFPRNGSQQRGRAELDVSVLDCVNLGKVTEEVPLNHQALSFSYKPTRILSL